MYRRLYSILLLLACLMVSFRLEAYPLTEKIPASGVLPLDVLSAQPSQILIPTSGDFKDKLMLIPNSSALFIVDLETWDQYETQSEGFTTTVSGVALLPNGTSVILGLEDGNLSRIELDDEDTFGNTVTVSSDSTDDDDDEEEEDTDIEELDSRGISIASDMTDPGISFIVADPTEDTVYMVGSSGYYFKYSFTANKLTEVALAISTSSDSTASGNYTPAGMVFAASDAGDRILIPTTTGEIVMVTPSSGSYTAYTLSSSAVDNASPNFAAITLTPDNNYAFVVDSTNDVVWVFSIRSGEFEDQQSSGTSLDPIEVDSDFNSTFSNIMIFSDADDVAVAYLAGASGITLLNVDDPGESSSDSKVIDADASDATADEDPIVTVDTPGVIAATSASAGYVFSANSDETISIFTDNPWITISSSPSTTLTTEASTFTLTFQTDIAGTYNVMAGSDPSASTGTELLASTAIDTVDTDTTTAEIDINNFPRVTFREGSNKIFVFVTDADSHLGHTAALVTVDRPPLPITITDADFGNKKAYITFEPSEDEDIASYVLYGEPAADQGSPTCPDSLTFGSSDAVAASVEASGCDSDDSCTAVLPELTNDITYCVAVNTIDESGQESGLAYFSGNVTPEQTVGPAGFLGETSCALNPVRRGGAMSWIILFAGPVLLMLHMRRGAIYCARPQTTFFLTIIFIFIASATTQAHAKPIPPGERTPQNWTFEVRGSLWLPTDGDVRSFVGVCCNLGGELEFGYLYKNRYNFTVTTGFGYNSGSAIGINNGLPSSDKYNLMMIPARLDFIYRFDFKPNQLFLPFARMGFDTVYFRETSGGDAIQNFKFGAHAGAGVGVLLDRAEQIGAELEQEIGVNDVYLTVEARYAFINSFKSTGLDLSGFYPYVGVLLEF